MCGSSESKQKSPMNSPLLRTNLKRLPSKQLLSDHSNLFFQEPYKVITVGPSGVGKSALLRRIATGEYTDKYTATIGVDLFSTFIVVHGLKAPLHFHLLDTAGQERFRAFTRSYFRDSHVILFTLCESEPDMIDLRLYKEMVEWIPSNGLLFLVCTKIDRESNGVEKAGIRHIPNAWRIPEEVQERVGYVTYYVSSAEGWGISVLKNDIGRRCWETTQNEKILESGEGKKV